MRKRITDLSFDLASESFGISASIVPWDTNAFGYPVAQISSLEIRDYTHAIMAFQSFREWFECAQVRVISCRLPHMSMRESMFLESNGFRFVEMVLHPYCAQLETLSFPNGGVEITRAEQSDISALQSIAETAFGYERYHVDPRLDAMLGNRRYGQWIINSFTDSRQNLFKAMDHEKLIGFFITETRHSTDAYWHLTAIAPLYQGHGYGRRTWYAMLNFHRDQGTRRIDTTISARNIRVLNLYASLGFKFGPPEMTFHWVSEG